MPKSYAEIKRDDELAQLRALEKDVAGMVGRIHGVLKA